MISKTESSSEKVVREIRRNTRRKFSAEDSDGHAGEGNSTVYFFLNFGAT